MTYVELHAHSAYSFLDGASQPEELAARAAELGYQALALTDHDGVYGSLEFAHAAKHFGVRPITGAELTLEGGAHVTLLVETPQGYANLCRLLTAAHAHTRDSTTREPLPPALDPALLEELNEGLVCLSGCARHGIGVHYPNAAARLAAAFGRDCFFVELQRPYERGDARRNAALRDLAESLGVRTVATGDVHAHDIRRAALQDVLVAVRCRTSLDGCERERRGNHECVLAAPADMLDRFADDRGAVERTRELAERLEFDLTQELGYRYPDFSDGADPAIAQLTRICSDVFVERYGNDQAARARLYEELALIDELGHAGLVASFATYRSRGAIRDVGKALGLPFTDLERLAKLTDGWNASRVAEEVRMLPDAERKLASPRWRAFAELYTEIAGLPRHISQHPGGMVISTRPLVELVPVQPAAMAGRQMCQWDKDSCADAGFLKIDLLGLGMLSAVEECVDMI